MIDFHTHRLDATDAIISLQPTNAADIIASRPHGTYSVGIHPWDTTAPADTDFDTVARLASLPQVVAIGETGLDRLRGADIATQELLFEQHIQLSETLRKPLIIHCVKAWDILLELHRRHRPSMPWGVHGFRGNPALARQLLDKGLYLSLGQHFNPATAALIPDHRLLAETDESSLPITAIAALINTHRSTPAPLATTLTTFLTP
ncbi:MAG: hydrolase TatD [Bacteroides sp.]|nr:hydrolase TatD [Bacteroides sp.]